MCDSGPTHGKRVAGEKRRDMTKEFRNYDTKSASNSRNSDTQKIDSFLINASEPTKSDEGSIAPCLAAVAGHFDILKLLLDLGGQIRK